MERDWPAREIKLQAVLEVDANLAAFLGRICQSYLGFNHHEPAGGSLLVRIVVRPVGFEPLCVYNSSEQPASGICKLPANEMIN